MMMLSSLKHHQRANCVVCSIFVSVTMKENCMRTSKSGTKFLIEILDFLINFNQNRIHKYCNISIDFEFGAKAKGSCSTDNL